MIENEVCSKCWSEISKNAVFCSTCGNIQIKNHVIRNRTTAEYDPRGKDYKPWKEKSVMATNSWKNRNQNILIRKNEPWRPPMNQPNVYLKKGRGKPSQVPSELSEEEMKTSIHTLSTSTHIPFERLNSKRILLYKGRFWSKAGNAYRKKKTIFTTEMIYGYNPKSATYNETTDIKTIPPISLYPLGIYPLDWFTLELYTFNVHITLLRRSFQSKYDHTMSTHWLRIGYEREINPTSPSESVDITADQDRRLLNHQFCVVAYLPNSIAKCLGATMQDGWVDLQYIEHLQTTLAPIADRVIPISPFSDLLFDQNCRIVMTSFGRGKEDDYSSTFTSGPTPITYDSKKSLESQSRSCPRVHSMVEEFNDVDQNDDGSHEQQLNSPVPIASSSLSAAANTTTTTDIDIDTEFKYNSYVAKISTGIPVGAYYLNRKIMSIVYLDILWRYDLQDDLLTTELVDDDNDCESDNEAESTASMSNMSKSRKANDWLTQVPFIEGVLLRVYPSYYDGQLLQPKVLKIHVDSLADLLIPHQKDSKSGKGEEEDESTVLFGENTNPVSQHILKLLEQGPHGARALCRELVSIIRFEYTTLGLKLFVHGVDSIYTICDTPEQIQRQIQTREMSAVRIQSAWRGKLGRTRAIEAKKHRDRMIELQRQHAMIQVQRMIRGFMTRRRYLAIVAALATQKRALEKQASLPPEVLMTPVTTTTEEPKLTPLVVQINGTEVEIILTPDCEILPTKGFFDCLVTVTDVITRRSTSTILTSSALSRFWNQFKRLPLEYSQASVRILHLKLTDLKQVDLIGRNDPYILLTYGDTWKVQTDVIDEGGSDVEWKITSEQQERFQFPILSTEVTEKLLEVAVFDANQFRSDVLVGEVGLTLASLQSLTSYGDEISLTREIKKKGKVTGYFTLTCDLQHLANHNSTGDGAVENEKEGEEEKEEVAKSTVHSLSDLFSHPQLTKNFMKYLSKKHLELFFSRANNVMVLRAIG